MPSLSIIIPVYNVESYLRQCLDSILVDNQFTGQIICVNDGSTDGSLAILEQYASKYSNIDIISQSNAGLSAARNAGLNRATGDYVFFPDSDDWIMPHCIIRVMSRIDDEDVVYFNAKLYYEQKQCFGAEIDIPNLKNMTGSAYFAAIYGQPRNMPFVCVCGGFYKRAFLLKHHLYNKTGIYHEDNFFTPQVLLVAKKVSSINEYVYAYRIRQGSITARVTEKHIKDLLFVARNLYAIYDQKEDVSEVFYSDVSGIYASVITKSFSNRIDLNSLWRKSDSRMMFRGAVDELQRKMAKVSFLSPYLSYRYLNNNLPLFARRLINRFL